jgi:hypothetical protein
MKDIEVSYTVGNEIKQLQIKFMSNGVGQIMIGNWYHGQCVFAQNQWRVYLNARSELNNSEDIQALIQILTTRKE